MAVWLFALCLGTRLSEGPCCAMDADRWPIDGGLLTVVAVYSRLFMLRALPNTRGGRVKDLYESWIYC